LAQLDNNKTKKEEHSERTHIMEFMKSFDYNDVEFGYEKDNIDLSIKVNDTIEVLFETKSSNETRDMVSADNFNVKPLHQIIYYFMKQRIAENNELKHLIITNGYNWYVFNAEDFNNIFLKNKELLKYFSEKHTDNSTQNFYDNVAKPFIENSEAELKATHFNLSDYKNKNNSEIKALYKLLSSAYLLKKKKKIDSNKLNTKFFKELLHIMGLEEHKEKNKKIIRQKIKPDEGSLLENLKAKIESHGTLDGFKNIKSYGNTYEEQLFGISLELVLTWVNRLLFLKLLEGQLVAYHNNDEKYNFLDYTKVNEFDILDTLFFEVLNSPIENRKDKIIERYPFIPYLNSSLFEPSDLEKKAAFISAMKDNLVLPLMTGSVLINETGKLPTLDYLLKFLEAYNFASHSDDDVYAEKGELINAAVLGLIFEKINGYKDGSFFTPGFITEYMARETIRKAVIQKFNDRYSLDIDNFTELFNYVSQKAYKEKDRKEYNELINSLKIIDPAVGSGHFLVSALNEILAIKSELGILSDINNKPLLCNIKVENDTSVITTKDDLLFSYTLNTENEIIEAKNILQSGIFNEKKTIIENCLFGVDINPNSVKITRLRLWIELLKNAYYKDEKNLETLPNIDINIKEGNSLISRFDLDADITKILDDNNLTIEEYQNKVSKYHNATDKTEKRELREVISKIKNNFESDLSKNDKRLIRKNKLFGTIAGITNQTEMFELSKTEQKKKDTNLKKLNKEFDNLENELNEIKNNVIYRNAFEWRFEFPEVLDKSGNYIGFDVVIGNPPYVVLSSFSGDEFNLLQKKYPTAFGRINTFAIFTERITQISRLKGFNSIIIPDSICNIDYYQNLRKYLLDNFSILEILELGDGVFDEATVPAIILSMQNKKQKHNLIKIGSKEAIFNDTLKKETFQKHFYKTPKYSFNLHIDDLFIKIQSSLKNTNTFSLKDIATIKIGICTGSNKKHIAQKPIFENSQKLLQGKNINRYSIQYDNLFINYNRKELLRARDENIFLLNEKLLMRQTSDKLIIAYDNSQFYNIDSLFNIFSDKISLKYLLSLMNSKLLNRHYQKLNPEKGRVFAQVKIDYVNELPIIINTKTEPIIIEKADKILSLKKEDPTADTSKLEAEIDLMVYELYELTAEEIQIIEESVK